MRPTLLLGCLALLATPALAQPTGGLAGAVDPATTPDARVMRAARLRLIDRVLDASDVDALRAAAGERVNAREGATLLAVVEKTLPGLPDYGVTDEARAHLIDLACTLDLQPASREAVAAGTTYAGTETPAGVREVLARARLNGAAAYDVTEEDDDGEGVYTHYPSITPATENMRFEWTQVTPAALEADLRDETPRLAIRGSEQVTIEGDAVSVVRYEVRQRGTGSIAASYDEAFHPVRRFDEVLREQLGYPEWMRDWGVEAIREARSTSGDRWASNCAILADGSVHCLPAARRHSSSPGLILTNPALARGRQLLWHGHLTARAGVITSVGTAGRVSRRVAEGRDVVINPLPLLKAWGFQLAPGLAARSEHATARYQQDDAACVLRQLPE